MARLQVLSSLLLATVQLVAGDIYMHTPSGSNNRMCEKKDNTQNDNRLFDSQNNNQGGYACRGDPAFTVNEQPAQDHQIFYAGSRLRIEWTSQHGGGGNSKTVSQTILQTACEDTLPGLRDPVAQGEIIDAANGQTEGQFFKRAFIHNNEQGTASIPNPDEINKDGETPLIPEDPEDPDYEQALRDFYSANTATEAGIAGAEYGLREGYEYYDECTHRERMNVWTGDENVGPTADRTRQNNNGQQHGFECPEERDYYPYAGPSPFVDLAIFTADTSHCSFYQTNSQNVKSRGRCTATRENGRIPNNEADCNAISEGMWEVVPSHDKMMPSCGPHPFVMDNHLGAVVPVVEDGSVDSSMSERPQMAHYDLIVPSWMENQKCIFRIRYNISTLDNMPHEYLNDDGVVTGPESNCDPDTEEKGGQREGETKSECLNVITADSVPMYSDPHVTYLTGEDTHELAIALDTNQWGRTFQDQSYVFQVEPMPEEMQGDTVWNLMTRGRRGNIVQAFPGLEYDQSSEIIDSQTLQQGDWIVYNHCGTWFNEENVDGEGNNAMDGSNLCALDDVSKNFPMHESRLEDSLFKGNVDSNMYRSLCNPPFYAPPLGEFAACTGTSCCRTYLDAVVNGEQSDAEFEQDITNCGVLNHMDPCFQTSFQVQADAGTEYAVVSTRNNNFSNRSQKSRIFVASSLSVGAIAGIAIASVAVAGAGVGFGVYKFKNRALSGNSAV